MYDMYKSSNCGCSSRPDHGDKKDKVCDIKSECCDGLVKEQFSIEATATDNKVTVYENLKVVNVRATVKVINLSAHVDIKIFVDDNKIATVEPNDEFVFTANILSTVKIKTQEGKARALLCFDLQVCNVCCPRCRVAEPPTDEKPLKKGIFR